MSVSILSINRPPPQPSGVSAPFWDALAEDRFVLQRCESCQAFVHPPKPICPECHASKFGWPDVARTGTVYSFTEVHRPPLPLFRDAVPYTVALVDIDHTGVRVLGNFVDDADAPLQIGQRVRLVIDHQSDGVALFHFVSGDQAQ